MGNICNFFFSPHAAVRKTDRFHHLSSTSHDAEPSPTTTAADSCCCQQQLLPDFSKEDHPRGYLSLNGCDNKSTETDVVIDDSLPPSTLCWAVLRLYTVDDDTEDRQSWVSYLYCYQQPFPFPPQGGGRKVQSVVECSS